MMWSIAHAARQLEIYCLSTIFARIERKWRQQNMSRLEQHSWGLEKKKQTESEEELRGNIKRKKEKRKANEHKHYVDQLEN